MASQAEKIAASLGRFFSGRAATLALLVVAAIVLYGSVPGGRLPLLLVTLAVGRGLLLLREALRRKVQPEEVARADLERQRGLGRSSRPLRLIACEALGLLVFVLLVPFDFILYSRDIVSLRSSWGFVAFGVSALGIGLYAWPYRWAASEGREERQMLWWALPFIPAAVFAVGGMTTHHPYLDPRRDDRTQLRAERVISLQNNIQAGAHADWVFEYALELEERGETQRAVEYYRKGLRLAPRNAAAHSRLAMLEARLDPASRDRSALSDPRPFARGLSPDEVARLPFWPAGRPLRSLRPCRVDESLEVVGATTVVIFRAGDVPKGITDAVGDVIQWELGLLACMVPEPIPLPTATRVRGVVGGRQWHIGSLVKAFLPEIQPVPNAPLKFLIVTPADIYADGSNFMFSGTYAWGAVLSYARYGNADDPQTVHRTAKQALGALAKSFGLPTSQDPNCVTSYANGLSQFDAKGDRLNAESYAMLRARVDAQDQRWRTHRARGEEPR